MGESSHLQWCLGHSRSFWAIQLALGQGKRPEAIALSPSGKEVAVVTKKQGA